MQLLQTLRDIASHIQIESSNFRITHSHFPPIETHTDVVAQLQKMSLEIQYKCLNLKLLELIYNIYYDGSFVIEASRGVNTNDQILQKIASVEVDWKFYKQLDKNNKGKGWFHPLFRVLKQEADGSLAVQFDGLTVHIQRDRHLQLVEQSTTIDDVIPVLMPSSFIEKDLYMAIGDAVGNFAARPKDYSNQAVLIYFNFSPEAAITAMKCITTKLNAINVPFIFKVLYNPLKYKRYDSGILRFEKDSYKLIRQVLKTIYSEKKSHFQNQVPLFTKVLAPGIGLAESPHRELQFRYLETFGWNRCQIVANALMEAHQKGNKSPEARMKYILQHFDLLGIDLERPYLNSNSKDIYTSLD